MMKRSAVIHVGLEKTGSTAIQAWLHAERNALLQAGIFVPISIGKPNHVWLVAACLDDVVVDNIKSHHMFRADRPETADYSTLKADMESVLARYRSAAAALPKLEKPRPVLDRFMSNLRRGSGQ